MPQCFCNTLGRAFCPAHPAGVVAVPVSAPTPTPTPVPEPAPVKVAPKVAPKVEPKTESTLSGTASGGSKATAKLVKDEPKRTREQLENLSKRELLKIMMDAKLDLPNGNKTTRNEMIEALLKR